MLHNSWNMYNICSPLVSAISIDKTDNVMLINYYTSQINVNSYDIDTCELTFCQRLSFYFLQKTCRYCKTNINISFAIGKDITQNHLHCCFFEDKTQDERNTVSYEGCLIRRCMDPCFSSQYYVIYTTVLTYNK